VLWDINLGTGKDEGFFSTKISMLDPFHFIDKFRSIIFSALVYLSLAYAAIKKRWRMVCVFFACELFLIVFFLRQSYHIRYLLPVYPIYLMVSFGFLWDISKSLVKNYSHVLFAGMIVLNFVLSISAMRGLGEPIYIDTDKDIMQMSDYMGQHLIPGSRVYLGPDVPEDVYFHLSSGLIDFPRIIPGSVGSYDGSGYGGRFNYVLIDEPGSADYVLCLDCARYGQSGSVIFNGIYGRNISLMKIE
jgi:hypothetical protein